LNYRHHIFFNKKTLAQNREELANIPAVPGKNSISFYMNLVNNNTFEKIKGSIKRKDAGRFLVFVVIGVIVFIGLTFYKPYFSKALNVLLVVELILIALIAYGLAAHAVIKSLFFVGAGLSLMIYLAETYCELPVSSRTGDDALKTLLGIGLIYIAVDFLCYLYKEVTARSKTLKEVDGKRPWFVLVPFAMFTGLFLWQIYQVMNPIVLNLCIYK